MINIFKKLFNIPQKTIFNKITDNFTVIGGYYNITLNTSALIGYSSDNIFYFFPINTITKKLIFPCKEISSETLNGFNNAKNNFIGFRGYKMERMHIFEVIWYYTNYSLSYDPSDMPEGW